MSETVSKTLWAFFAIALGVFLLFFAINKRVEFLGIALSITTNETQRVLLAVGITSVLVGIVLGILVFFGLDITESSFGFDSPHSPSIRKALAKLGDLEGRDRIKAIETIGGSLPKELSGPDTAAILGPLSGFDRVSAIKLLGPRIREDISEQDITSILEGLDGRERKSALQALEEERSGLW